MAELQRSDLKQKWQDRFNFFDQYGNPTSKVFEEEMKRRGWRARLRISTNRIAFFLGPFYFFFLGMWRKGFSLFGVAAAVSLAWGVVASFTDISFDTVRAVQNGVNFGLCYLSCLTANYAYYCKMVKGENGWNPFNGIKWR